MEEQKDIQFLTPEEAWDDFYRVVYQQIKHRLEWHEKNRVITANRDRKGLRKRASGTVIGLDVERIRAILDKYAPGRYGVETVTRFWILPTEAEMPPGGDSDDDAGGS